ncbi:MAG: hypothetical protein AAGI01_07700 [Myxococcota bacterium]
MSDPSEILERRLRDVVEDGRDSRGLHFFCQIGGTYHPEGMITVQLSGTGWLLAGWKRQEEMNLFSLRLSERDHTRLYEVLLEHPFWGLEPARRPRTYDDELNIHVRISDLQAGTWSGIQFWAEDMKEVPLLDDLMYRILRLVWIISDGEIPIPYRLER